MSAPLFSIITVTLNCVEDALRTAHSVLNQEFSDYEYIVKDGGSHDGTVERLRQLGIVAHSSPDTGIYDAMNQAVEHCLGDYICFMNAGDTLVDAKVLSTVASSIARHQHPDFVYGDVISLDGYPTDSPSGDQTGRLILYRNRLSRYYLYRRTICHQVWFIRREIHEKMGGFDTSFHISSAHDFLLKMVLHAKVRYAHVPVVVAVYQGGGISSIDSPEKRRERREILKRYYHHIERLCFAASFSVMRFVGRVFKVFAVRYLTRHQQGRFHGF